MNLYTLTYCFVVCAYYQIGTYSGFRTYSLMEICLPYRFSLFGIVGEAADNNSRKADLAVEFTSWTETLFVPETKLNY
jgi:hypothetical protein